MDRKVPDPSSNGGPELAILLCTMTVVKSCWHNCTHVSFSNSYNFCSEFPVHVHPSVVYVKTQHLLTYNTVQLFAASHSLPSTYCMYTSYITCVGSV